MPIDYDRLDPYQFGGVLPGPRFDDAPVVILPVPFDRTTSVHAAARATDRASCSSPRRRLSSGTRSSARTCTAAASSRCPRWTCRRRRSRPRWRPCSACRATSSTVTSSSSRLAASTRSPRPSWRRRPRGTKVSAFFRSTRTPTCATRIFSQKHSHACAMRRTLEHAKVIQVGIRNISEEEIRALPVAPDDDLLRLEHARGSGLDRSRDRRPVRRGLYHDRSGRSRSGDHAGRRHAGAGRLVVA